MACFKFTLTRSRFLNLVAATLTLHVLLIAGSASMLIYALSIKMTFGNYVNDISPNDGNIMPIMLALISFLSLIVNSMGLKYSVMTKTKKLTTRKTPCLCLYIIASMIIVVANIAIVIIALVHLRSIPENIHEGFMNAMKKYSEDETLKITIDLLQVQFHCCGSLSYKEWFYISWFDLNLGGVVAEAENHFVSDDVPFSCCEVDVLRPCIHHGILSSSNVYRYDPQSQVSVSFTGCHGALMKKYSSIVRESSIALVVLGALQLAACVCSRLLHTALTATNMAVYTPDLEYTVWLFGGKPNIKYEQPSTTEEDTTDESTSSKKLKKRVPSAQ